MSLSNKVKLSADFGLSNIIDLKKKFYKTDLVEAKTISLWAVISANHDKGIVLDNVDSGDTVTIETASGIAAFDQTSLKEVKSIITLMGAVAWTGAELVSDGEAAIFTGLYNAGLKAIEDAMPDKVTSTRRDPWGMDPDGGDYAKDEGGLIVCMPEAHGAIYSDDDTHLQGDTKNKGRIPEYYPQAIVDKNSFFPCTCDQGVRSGTARQAGAAVILAFDSKFDDNVGWYEVKITVERASKP